ncbi:hypothetical protein MCEMIE11_01320 [Burkholderiales bacterium]
MRHSWMDLTLVEALRGRARRAHTLLFLGLVCLLSAWLMNAMQWFWLPPAAPVAVPAEGAPVGLHASVWAWLGGFFEGHAQGSVRGMRIVNDWMTTGLPGWVIWVPAGLLLWLLALIDLAVLGLSIRRQLAASAAMLVEPEGLLRETPSLPTDNTLVAPVLIDPPSDTPSPAAAAESNPSLDAVESQLYSAEHQLEGALSALAVARHGLLNLSLDPDGPHRDDDMQKARASLDQAEQALTKLRGQQHALIAGLVGLRRHVH